MSTHQGHRGRYWLITSCVLHKLMKELDMKKIGVPKVIH